MDDNVVERGEMPEAITSLPKSLCVRRSRIPGAGLGVFTKKKIEVNTRFGPYRGVKVLEKGEDTSYMWQVYSNLSCNRNTCVHAPLVFITHIYGIIFMEHEVTQLINFCICEFADTML